MDLVTQKNKYRSQARRFKQKYLTLVHKLNLAKANLNKMSLGNQTLLSISEQPIEVVALSDVEALLDDCLASTHNKENEQ